VINGMDRDAVDGFRESVTADVEKAERWPTVAAQWVGGSRARIAFEDKTLFIGGDDDLNSMQVVLAALAACDVDVVAMHASMLGIEVRSLRVEASGHYNVQSYAGVDGAPGSGYDTVRYNVILDAPDATPDQLDYLRERCERSSPVGDTLSRVVELTLEFTRAER